MSRVEAAPARGEKLGGVLEGPIRSGGGVEGTGAAPGAGTPPGRPQEETNGVAVVTQQELEFNTKVGKIQNIIMLLMMKFLIG